MKTRSGVVVLGAVLFAALSSGCSSGGSSNCSEPVIDGTTNLFVGSATVHGTGTLPAGSPEGDALVLFLELLLGTKMTSGAVVPPDPTRLPATCGRTFKYTVRDLAAGTYGFSYRLIHSGSSSTMPEATGSSTETFTIADGEDLEVDPTF
jgi:hypothetical protein